MSAHGKRLLLTLADQGIILNGLIAKDFSKEFTRLPQSSADCPGVIDYICGPPSILRRLPNASLTIGDSIPDFSDHLRSSIEVLPNKPEQTPEPDATQLHFHEARLQTVKVPDDENVWEQINDDLASAPEMKDI